MSNLDPMPTALSLRPGVVRPVDVLEARKAAIGDGTEVRRVLPQRALRTIGAWCFLDHYGPDDVSAAGTRAAGPDPAAAPIGPGLLAHLPTGGSAITLSAPGPCRFFVVGGVPLGERLVMWWNFAARTGEEIAAARDAWINGEFGEARGYQGNPLAAPPLPPGGLKAR